MASTYSELKIELIADGEQSGSWGSTTNVNLGTSIEEAITGRADADFASDADLTLGYTDSNATQAFRNLILNVTSSVSLTASRNLIVPTIDKQYIIENNTTGGQSIVVKTSGGTGITVPNGKTVHVYADSTNVVQAVDFIPNVEIDTVNIDGGAIDGVTIGTNSPATEVQIDNININGNSITSTDTNGDISITPDGTGEVNISKVDIDGGTIDGATIATSDITVGAGKTLDVSAGTFTVANDQISGDAISGGTIDSVTITALAGNISVGDNDITNVGDIQVDSVSGDADTNTKIRFEGSDQLAFDTDGSERVMIDSSGNVGIGTDSPAQLLDVNGDITVADESAYKTTTQNLPDIRPSLNLDFANTKKLDPRIDFTRTTTATYYDGVTHAKAEENLLKYSQDFDNGTYFKQLLTVTANATTAPDGTTTADELVATGNGEHKIDQSNTVVINDTYRVSVFAKESDTDDMQVLCFHASGDNDNANFNLNTGTIIDDNSFDSSATIEDVGNGWYRCSFNFKNTSDTSTSVSIRPRVSGNVSYDASVTPGSIFLWGLQVEQRSSLTAYTPTVLQPITNYVPALQTAAAGEARFDHDPVTGESLGLLVEEQRTNLVLRSEEFDNAAWSKANASITADTIVAPDGTLTGDKLIADTASLQHQISQSFTFTADTTYALSLYAKAGGENILGVGVGGNGKPITTNFDLSTLTFSGDDTTGGAIVSKSATSVGNNWYRIALVFTTDSSGTVPSVIRISPRGFALTAGDGYSGVYIWGAQLEQASFPTSYIATSGSTATRNADSAEMTGTNFSSWYRQDEGTFYSSVERDDLGASATVLSTSQEGASFGPRHQVVFTASNLSKYDCRDDSGSTAATNLGITTSRVFAVGYKTNDFAATGGGNTPGTDTSGNVPVNNAELWIGRLNNGNPVLNGTIKKLAFYPKRLPNATLQALTEE